MIHSNPDLIASYLMQSRFIDSDGKLIDLSGNGHNATITAGVGGFTTGPDGKVNGAYEFDGSDTKMDCGSDFIRARALTISTVIRLDSFGEGAVARLLDNGSTILSNWGGAYGTWRFSSNGSTRCTAQTGIGVFGEWYLIIVTRSLTGVTNFYINGILSGTANQNSGTPVAGTTNVIIGNNLEQNYTIDGPMASMSFYNTVYGQDWASYQYKKFQQQIQSGRFKGLI